MRKIITGNNQTLWDIAIEYLGDIAAVFDIIRLNEAFSLDMTLPTGIAVYIPDEVLEPKVTNYFENNNLRPASGQKADPTVIIQEVNYDFANGQATLDSIALGDAIGGISVQVHITGLNIAEVMLNFEQSNDGNTWSQIDGAVFILNPELETLTFELPDVITNYIRCLVSAPDSGVTGVLTEIIYTL